MRTFAAYSLVSAFTAAAVLALSLPAAAAGIVINSSSLVLGPGHESGTIDVQSQRGYPDVVQVKVYRWNGGGALQNLAPTDDLLGVPMIFTIPPGGSQIVRVAMRGPVESAQEQAYRVIVEEIPSKYTAHGWGFSLLMRLNFPVFIVPDVRPRPDPLWSLRRDGRTLHLTLSDRGNVHVRVRDLTLYDAAHRVVARSNQDVTVMPGSAFTWTLPVRAPAQGPLQVRADSDVSTIVASVQ